jgi:hypothetical protein
MLVAHRRWIAAVALALWAACCSPAVAASGTLAAETPAPQFALRADHMVLIWEVPARPEGSSP